MSKREKKGRPTSIRLFPETEKYLIRCKGDNLTEKFEYLVKFCMKREEMLAKVEEEYQARFKVYEEEIKELKQLLSKFQIATQNCTEVIKEINQVYEKYNH